MKSRYVVLLTLLAVILPVGIAGSYVYKKVTSAPPMQIVDRKEVTIIFKEVIGRYGNAPQEISTVAQQLDAAKITCEQQIGQYLFGKFTLPDQQRGRYGCAVKTAPKELPDGLSIGKIPAGTYASLERSQKGMLASVAMSLQLAQFAHEQGYVPGGYVVEFYGARADPLKQAAAYMPVSKFDEPK